jgi:hypothetical protein
MGLIIYIPQKIKYVLLYNKEQKVIIGGFYE